MQKKTPQQQTKSNDAKAPKADPPITNPSEKLANLLRKEGMITAKLQKAKDELKAVQGEIQQLWAERNKQTEELMDE